jgi:hypothetical protein
MLLIIKWYFSINLFQKKYFFCKNDWIKNELAFFSQIINKQLMNKNKNWQFGW